MDENIALPTSVERVCTEDGVFERRLVLDDAKHAFILEK